LFFFLHVHGLLYGAARKTGTSCRGDGTVALVQCDLRCVFSDSQSVSEGVAGAELVAADSNGERLVVSDVDQVAAGSSVGHVLLLEVDEAVLKGVSVSAGSRASSVEPEFAEVQGPCDCSDGVLRVLRNLRIACARGGSGLGRVIGGTCRIADNAGDGDGERFAGVSTGDDHTRAGERTAGRDGGSVEFDVSVISDVPRRPHGVSFGANTQNDIEEGARGGVVVGNYNIKDLIRLAGSYPRSSHARDGPHIGGARISSCIGGGCETAE